MAMIQGKARWVKILGKPIDGYDPGEKNKQWEFEVETDDQNRPKFVELEIEDKLKTDKDNVEFFKFVKKAYNKDGEANKPIRVVGPDGKDWDRKVLIGNGSTLNVKFNVQDWEFGKKQGKRISILAVQVWEHVPYEGGEQFPVREGAPAGEAWGDEDEDEA